MPVNKGLHGQTKSALVEKPFKEHGQILDFDYRAANAAQSKGTRSFL